MKRSTWVVMVLSFLLIVGQAAIWADGTTVAKDKAAETTVAKGEQDSSHKLCLKFDEGQGRLVKDSSLNNIGIAKGGTKWTSGDYGTALEFDGEDGCVRLSKPVDLGDGSRSIEVWFAPATVAKAETCLFGNLVASPAPNTLGYCLNVQRARIVFQFANKEGRVVMIPSKAVTPGEWYHAVAIYDKQAEEISLYVNGEEAGRRKVSGHKPSPYAEAVACNGVSNCWYYAGIIRQVNAYSRAMSVTEIVTNYAAGISK